MAAADILGVRTLHLQDEEIPDRKLVKEEDKNQDEQWIPVNEGWFKSY